MSEWQALEPKKLPPHPPPLPEDKSLRQLGLIYVLKYLWLSAGTKTILILIGGAFSTLLLERRDSKKFKRVLLAYFFRQF